MRLIGEDGSQVGIIPTEKALEMAREAGLDLVEVAPNARPPVCRIMDFNKLQYEKRRKSRDSRKKAKQVHIKEVKFRPAIGHHDFMTKARRVRRFLEHGDKVKLTLMFRGRQIVHPDLGRKVLKDVIEEVADIGQLEGNIQMQGRFMGALLVARPKTENADQQTEEKQPVATPQNPS